MIAILDRHLFAAGAAGTPLFLCASSPAGVNRLLSAATGRPTPTRRQHGIEDARCRSTYVESVGWTATSRSSRAARTASNCGTCGTSRTPALNSRGCGLIAEGSPASGRGVSLGARWRCRRGRHQERARVEVAAAAAGGGGGLASFVDVCAGIGGFHCAARAALPGAVCGQLEAADRRRRAATRPDDVVGRPSLGDARTARWPAADLVCAGMIATCQPLSRASRVAAAAHPDANFALEVLLGCLDATRARAVVLENAPQLRTTGRATFEALWLLCSRRL